MATFAPRLRAAARLSGPATTWLFGTALASTSASASAMVTWSTPIGMRLTWWVRWSRRFASASVITQVAGWPGSAATPAMTSAARRAAPSVCQRPQSVSRRRSSSGHSSGAGKAFRTVARHSSAFAPAFCSVKGRGCGRITAGVSVAAKSATEFCPPAVTAMPADCSSSVGSSTWLSPPKKVNRYSGQARRTASQSSGDHVEPPRPAITTTWFGSRFTPARGDSREIPPTACSRSACARKCTGTSTQSGQAATIASACVYASWCGASPR